MSDKYYNIRMYYGANIPGTEIMTHYYKNPEQYEMLIKQIGQFVHHELPKILKNTLTIVLPIILAVNLKNIKNHDEIIDLYTNELNRMIFEHYNINPYPKAQEVQEHISGKATKINIDLPPELVLMYGESGIFGGVIRNFLNTFKNPLGHGISSWDTLELFIDKKIIHPTDDTDIFKNDGIRCPGRRVGIYMWKILLLNHILYSKDKGAKLFIPEKFYDDSELEKHFVENFKPSEA